VSEKKKRFLTLRRLAFVGLALVVAYPLISLMFRLPDNSRRPESHTIANGDDTALGRALGPESQAHPGQSGIVLLANGRDAFVARALLARQAERSIDLQYYMYHQDTVGNLLDYELLKAADRGVRVRMLIDDIYGNQGADTRRALDAHPSIEVRMWNPFVRGRSRNLQYVFRLKDINYRMHAKTFTVDNQAAILGGRNIGDEYFDADPGLAFTDLDALTVGAAVAEVSAEFDEYWNSEYAYPVSTLEAAGTAADLDHLRGEGKAFLAEHSTSVYVDALDHSDLARALRQHTVAFRWSEARIIHDSSEKKAHDADWQEELLISQLAPTIQNAQREAIIISPYFVPGERATAALCKLSRNGVRVRILTNSLVSNDVAAVHAGYAKYRKPLLRCGVELYELNENLRDTEEKMFFWLPGLGKSSLHAKTMAFDRETMFVGSFNFDPRSLHINNEIGILFKDPQIATESAENFDRHIEQAAFRVVLETDDHGRETMRWLGKSDGRDVTFDSEPYAGWGLRLVVDVLKLLPIESQL
jgi:putative cardiolipin synthase